MDRRRPASLHESVAVGEADEVAGVVGSEGGICELPSRCSSPCARSLFSITSCVEPARAQKSSFCAFRRAGHDEAEKLPCASAKSLLSVRTHGPMQRGGAAGPCLA